MTILNETALDLEEERLPSSHKFEWINRNACIEALVVLMDDGLKFDRAYRVIKLSDYAYNVSRMLVKQRNQLRKDAIRAFKDAQQLRNSANVGDLVRVPRLIPGVLSGTHVRDGLRLVDARVVQRLSISGRLRYTVVRLDDNGEQIGNSQMIKSIIQRADQQ